MVPFGVVILLDPEEWYAVMRSGRLLDHLRFLMPDADLQNKVGKLVLSLLSAELDWPATMDAKLVVDYPGPSSMGQLTPPEVPKVLPSERLATEAKRRALDKAHAERLAAGMRTFAFAWYDTRFLDGIRLEMETEDGRTHLRQHLDGEIYAQNPEALDYLVNASMQEMRAHADRVIREQLGYPAHLGGRHA